MYTSKEAVLNYLIKTLDSQYYSQLESWIVAMSRQIDRICNRVIWREDEETFKYDGDGTDMILIKDCIDPVVKIDGIIRPVLTYPTNKEYASRIKLDGYRFTKGKQNIEVTGLQCMALYLPDDIALACTIMVAGIIRNQIFGDKVGTTESIGNYQITYKNVGERDEMGSVKQILSGYTHIAL